MVKSNVPTFIPNAIKAKVQMPSVSYVTRFMKEGFRQALTDAYRSIATEVTKQIRIRFLLQARQSAEYLSMVHGSLRAHFGLQFPEATINPIIDRVASHILVTPARVRVVGQKFIGGLNIFLLRQDFMDILHMSESKYVSAPSGKVIPWLEWLLIGGRTTQVYTHSIDFGISQYSRSGKAIMIPGGSWGMNETGFAGTQDDNWLTRIFDDLELDINNILFNELSHII